MLYSRIPNGIRRRSSFSCSIKALDFSDSDSDAHAQIPNQDPSFNRFPQFQNKIDPRRLKMQELAKFGKLEEALQTLHLLKPTVLDYNALMHRYLRSGNVLVDELVVIFNGMKRFGPRPNVWTFNILANGLCSLGLLKDAFFVVEDMCINGFVPSFSMLMRLLKKSMSSSAVEWMLRFGYVPTSPVLNTLIADLTRAGLVGEAYRILFLVLDRGFVPDVYARNATLFGLCRSGRSCTALSLFCSFTKRGFVSNVYTYTSLVLGFSKEGLWEEAYRVLDRMHSDGCMPTVVTYTLLIKFLCRYKRVEEGLRVLEMMSERGCQPDLVTYNVLLGALCSDNRFSDAYNLMWAMVGNNGEEEICLLL